MNASFLDDLAGLGPAERPIANFDAAPDDAEFEAIFDLEAAGAFDADASPRRFR